MKASLTTVAAPMFKKLISDCNKRGMDPEELVFDFAKSLDTRMNARSIENSG